MKRLLAISFVVIGYFIGQSQMMGTGQVTIERAQNRRLIQKVTASTNASSQKIITSTNQWTEIETGMHFRDAQNEWQISKAELRIQQDGTAIGDTTPHKVLFGADVQTPITLTLPDGNVLRSRVLGIALYDFKNRQSVLLAELNAEGAVGELVGDNQILYRDVFSDDGISADIRYSYTKDGLEQDVIFRKRFPQDLLPEAFQFDPKSTWIEIWSEFLEGPEPQRNQQVRKGWIHSKVDKSLDFGSMTIGPGVAFPLGGNKHKGIAVQKHWETIGNRRFLIEEIPFRLCIPQMRLLPAAEQAALPNKRNFQIAGKRILPERKQASLRSKDKIQVAKADIKQNEPGFVLDYSIVQTATDFVFRGNETYLVLGNVNLSGTTVFEAGCVIKSTNTPSAKLNILGTVECLGSAYHPVIFTSISDDSVGQTIHWSDGPPGDRYGTALSLANGGTLQYCHFRYADTAIYSDADYTVKHSQFVHCGNALQTENTTFTAQNLLLYDVGTAFFGKFFHGTAEHITFNKGTNVTDDWFYDPGTCVVPPSSSITLVNSLITAVDNNGVVQINEDHVVNLSSADGVYKTVGGGGHYLADASLHRQTSTASIGSELADELRKMTTYAPVDLGDAYFATNTILRPQARRNVNLDCIGYLYPPLDFCIGNGKTISGKTLTLTNNVAVAFYHTDEGLPSALQLECGAKLISEGSALALNTLTWANCVQEQSNTNWSPTVAFEALGFWNYSCNPVEVRCRFTDFSAMAGSAPHIGTGDTGWGGTISLRDSLFRGGNVYFLSTTDYYPLTVGITNCVFDRCDVACWGSGASLTVDAYNNLFYKNAIALDDLETNSGTVLLTFKDNLFFKNSISQSANISLTHDYNSYLDTFPRLTSAANNDVVLSEDFTLETGPLSPFYQPNDSPLINAGSRNSTNAGLFHFCVTAEQVKETNSVVDIGAHWVALTNNVPIDSDGDTLADYFEDSDGDGFADPTEFSWLSADTDGDGITDFLEWLQGRNPLISGTVADSGNLIKLRVFTPLK